MVSIFCETMSTWRNLADQTQQREVGINSSWWKLLSVFISPDLVVIHAFPSSGITRIKGSSPFLQDSFLISHDSDRTSKAIPTALSEINILIVFPFKRWFLLLGPLRFLKQDSLRRWHWSKLRCGFNFLMRKNERKEAKRNSSLQVNMMIKKKTCWKH